MKICFTSHRYSPLIGGYDNQIKLLAEYVSKYYPVKVVTYNLTCSPQIESINNVEVIRVNPQLVFFRVPLSVNYLRKIGEQDFDVLHAHGFVPFVSDLSIAYAKSKEKTTVYTHHFDGNVQDATGWNVLADLYNKSVARQSFHYADAIIATTESYSKTSPALKPCLSKIQVIPCFVDCDQFKPESNEKVDALRKKLGLGDRKTVLFVGRIVPYKGVEYLIEALELAKAAGEELNLLLLGSGEGRSITDPSPYYKSIRFLAEKSTVHRNIRFLGKIDSSQLTTYYSLADVVVLPSVMRGEAFGTVLLEALACGTPVVASNIPGVCDVLKGDAIVGSYVQPRNSYALFKEIVGNARNKQNVATLCRQFVCQNYQLEKIGKTYVHLYRSLKK